MFFIKKKQSCNSFFLFKIRHAPGVYMKHICIIKTLKYTKIK